MNRQEAAGLILIGIAAGLMLVGFVVGWVLGALIP